MRYNLENYFPQQTLQMFDDYDGFPPPPTTPSVGRSITYEDIHLEEEIGRGGFGLVHRGSVDGIDVAVKEPVNKPAEIDDEFANEARFWQGLTERGSPPFIADFYAWGEDPHPWICIEYLAGGTVEQFVVEYVREHNGTLPLNVALWMGIIIASAVEYAHSQGVTHRDLKPDNVLLSETEEEKIPYPKLTDWGLARVPVFGDDDDLLFTPYAAPEQLRDDRHEIVDQSQGEGIDIYQVGLIIHFLLTGRHPVDSTAEMEIHQRIIQGDIPSPSERNPALPVGIDAIIMKAIAPQRVDRYENISKFRGALENLFRSCISVTQIRHEGTNYARSGTTDAELATSAKSESPPTLAPVWETKLSSQPVQMPLAIGNRLYIPTTNRIVSLNLETGRRIQSFDFGLPAAEDELVGLAAKRQQLYATTKQGRLISVRDEREIVDETQFDGNAASSPLIVPNREPDFVMGFLEDHSLHLFRVTSRGETKWEQQLGAGLNRPVPAYQPEQGRLWVVAGDRVAEIDVESGNEKFYAGCPKPVTTPVAYQDRLYYGADTQGGQEIVCVDTSRQGIDWSYRVGADLDISGIAVNNETVVATTTGTPETHGQLIAIERTEGNANWIQRFGNASLTSPSIGSEHVHAALYFDDEAQYRYLQNEEKVSQNSSDPQEVLGRKNLPEQIANILSTRLKSGERAYTARVPGEVTTRPIPRKNVVVTISDEGNCWCFNAG